jgi:hypothetical protein
MMELLLSILNTLQSMVIWLMKITNSIINLEMVPDFMKVGVVYKGGGKDPLKIDSHMCV